MHVARDYSIVAGDHVKTSLQQFLRYLDQVEEKQVVGN